MAVEAESGASGKAKSMPPSASPVRRSPRLARRRLELALSGVPMVAAYRLAAVEATIIRRLIRVPSVILANLVLEHNVVPEFLQDSCTPDRLAAALVPLLSDTPARRRQLDAFSRLDGILEIGRVVPSVKAAEIVVAVAHKGEGKFERVQALRR